MKFAAARSHHKENLDSILDLIYCHLLVGLKSQFSLNLTCSFMCVSVCVRVISLLYLSSILFLCWSLTVVCLDFYMMLSPCYVCIQWIKVNHQMTCDSSPTHAFHYFSELSLENKGDHSVKWTYCLYKLFF